MKDQIIKAMKRNRRILVFMLVVVSILALSWYVLDMHIFCHLNTQYSEKYTEEKFRSIKIGMTKEELYTLIGEPLVLKVLPVEAWYYVDKSKCVSELDLPNYFANNPEQVTRIAFEGEHASHLHDMYLKNETLNRELIFMSKERVLDLLGEPDYKISGRESFLFYTFDKDRIRCIKKPVWHERSLILSEDDIVVWKRIQRASPGGTAEFAEALDE